MNEMERDRELDWMRAQWDPPRMTPSAAAEVLSAYRREFRPRRLRGRFWLPVTAAAVAASLATALVRVRPETAYRPVVQPRIIVLSDGERP
jgi:hypothetical protein